MKIVRLSIDNVKRISAARIKPDGSLVTISGQNGAGKTSVLDAIEYALGGKASQPARPIRDGASEGRVVLELDGLTVRRRWTSNDSSTLIVESADGARFPSPQAVLDKLVGSLTFDPLAFSRMKPTDQVATLKRVAGLDFSAMDQRRAELFAKRTNVNRDLKAMEAQVDAMPDVDAPDEEVSVADLADERDVAGGLELRRSSKRQAAEAHDRTCETLRVRIESIKSEIDRLNMELSRKSRDFVEEAERAAVLRAEADDIVVPDVDAIAAKIRSAESTNANVRQRKARNKKLADVAGVRAEAERLTKAIDGIDARKTAELTAAAMPVPGLSFTADGVTFNGVPFDQASGAERLRVSVGMGLALNPKLRVMLIRDGSLLDSAGMRTLAELAEASDAQIWIERVSDGGAVGVVIEDGQVAGATEGAAA